MIDVEYNFFWNRSGKQNKAFIHCIEYDYKTADGGAGGEGDWDGMVSTISNKLNKVSEDLMRNMKKQSKEQNEKLKKVLDKLE